MAESDVGRGSDDKYCSAYPPEPHHYVSHSVQAPPIVWVEVCSMCRHINSAVLREQLAGTQDGESGRG